MSYTNNFKRIVPKSEELSDIFYKENASNYEVRCVRHYFESPSEYELNHTLIELPEEITGRIIENVYNSTKKHAGHWFSDTVTYPVWEVTTIAFVKKEHNA